MFAQRENKPHADAPTVPFVDPALAKSDPKQETDRRHAVLMECLNDERDRQAEERMQAAIDEDFYDHLQWRREDAASLLERGQAPLVFNESRQTIDWIAGTQKRLRKDYKILGREKSDEAGAEVVTQVVKYTDEANLTAWHESKAFKQAAISGLSWLEEGINVEPGEELIFSGSEDWRNVYRDSRSRQFDLGDARYQFRRKVTDLDYAMALMPKKKAVLQQTAVNDEAVDSEDVWYLGERLTGASDIDNEGSMPSSYRDRRAYIGNDQTDKGRRSTVELLECWYRVPEVVKVFQGGPEAGKIVNDAMNGHQQLLQDGARFYEAVKMAMRVMVGTKEHCLWDGPSPFEHNKFLLVPVWCYRRYRDGMAYGTMRGMRDLQEDTNKRASRSLWLLSNNRVVADKGAVDDIEEARDEIGRADGWVEKAAGKELRLEKHTAEAAGNLEMMDRNRQTMRNVGGVTDENLGEQTNAKSGIAIERRQDQGSLTTSELFDNLLLARKLRGRLRLAHIKQFKTEQQIIRIVGEGQPVTWTPINTPDPETGELMNDIASINCDYTVADQDYRESYVRAATAEMFELLGQIATFAPQVVLSVLDLAVEGSEVRNKDEWVARIRKLNGERDPTKEPTPEEIQAQQASEAEQAEAKELQRQTMMVQLEELKKKVEKLDVEAMAKRVDSMFASLQAAQIVAQQPLVSPVADVIAAGAGYKDQGGQDPNLPQPEQPLPMQTAQQFAPPPELAQPAPDEADPQTPQGLEGVNAGIETPTGADNGPTM